MAEVLGTSQEGGGRQEVSAPVEELLAPLLVLFENQLILGKLSQAEVSTLPSL